MANWQQIGEDVTTVLEELTHAGRIRAGQLVVIGVSTSEVLGKRIGTSGTEEAAAAIFGAVAAVSERVGFAAAFQCCEHLNRALVMDRATAERLGLEEVTVVPVAEAGGSMAAYAYRRMGADACVVESVRAHAGIDIGDTLIGMHLRHVAVPFRPSVKQIGYAHVTAAYTRPKLIGGERAQYRLEGAGAQGDAGQGTAGPAASRVEEDC